MMRPSTNHTRNIRQFLCSASSNGSHAVQSARTHPITRRAASAFRVNLFIIPHAELHLPLRPCTYNHKVRILLWKAMQRNPNHSPSAQSQQSLVTRGLRSPILSPYFVQFPCRFHATRVSYRGRFMPLQCHVSVECRPQCSRNVTYRSHATILGMHGVPELACGVRWPSPHGVHLEYPSTPPLPLVSPTLLSLAAVFDFGNSLGVAHDDSGYKSALRACDLAGAAHLCLALPSLVGERSFTSFNLSFSFCWPQWPQPTLANSACAAAAAPPRA